MADDGRGTSRLKIAILSSQSFVWLGLKTILESSMAGSMVIHSYPGRTAELLASERRPDLFIVDVETEHDILGTVRQIRETAPPSKIVLLCGLMELGRVREVFAVGVDGIILNVQPPAVVRAVIEGLYPCTNSAAPVDLDGASRMDFGFSLTEREREIIELVGKGLSNKDIAHKLSISDSTVRHHLTSIFDKVGVPNRQMLLVHVHHGRAPV